MGAGDDNKCVTIDVGGTVYTTTPTTLNAIPHSKLSTLDETSPYYDVKRRAYYFDRDADMFKHVLNAHRTGELHIPRDRCAAAFRREMEFWEIPIRMLRPCCWSHAYVDEGHIEAVKMIQGEWHVTPPINQVHGILDGGQMPPTWRAQLWNFMDNPNSSPGAKVWLFVYLAVVVLGAILYFIWLEPSLRVDPYLSSKDCTSELQVEYNLTKSSVETIVKELYNDKMFNIACTDPHPALFGLDCFCMLVFAVELVLHCFASPDRLRFFFNRYNLMNLIQVIIMIIVLSLELNKAVFTSNEGVARFYFGLKTITVCRLLLVIRINKVYRRMKLLTVALENSGPELRLLAVIFAMAAVIYAGLIFNAEIETKMFTNTFYALWWTVVTMTTVGYGDFYPTSIWGYIVGGLCAVSGIILISLPIAAIASNFSILHSANAEIERHCKALKDEERRNADIHKCVPTGQLGLMDAATDKLDSNAVHVNSQ